jgi:hypothetical protein
MEPGKLFASALENCSPDLVEVAGGLSLKPQSAPICSRPTASRRARLRSR